MEDALPSVQRLLHAVKQAEAFVVANGFCKRTMSSAAGSREVVLKPHAFGYTEDRDGRVDASTSMHCIAFCYENGKGQDSDRFCRVVRVHSGVALGLDAGDVPVESVTPLPSTVLAAARKREGGGGGGGGGGTSSPRQNRRGSWVRKTVEDEGGSYLAPCHIFDAPEGVPLHGKWSWFDEGQQRISVREGDSYRYINLLSLKVSIPVSPEAVSRADPDRASDEHDESGSSPRRVSLLAVENDVKFSPSGRFLVRQWGTGDSVQVVDLTKSERWRVRCRAKKGNTLLERSCTWLDDFSFFLVTDQGLEIFRYSSQKVDWRRVDSTKQATSNYWFLPPTETNPAFAIVLLASPKGKAGKNSAADIRCFAIQPGTPNTSAKKVMSFMIQCGEEGQDLSKPADRKALQRRVKICELYRRPCCIFLGQNGRKMGLYQLSRSAQGSKPRMFEIFGDGKAIIGTVDNLICLHMMDVALTLVYDPAGDALRPFGCPLPICFPTDLVQNGKDSAAYGKNCHFLWPRWLIRQTDSTEEDPAAKKHFELWKLRIDPASTMKISFGSAPGDAIAFLLRRQDVCGKGGTVNETTLVKQIILEEALESARQRVDIAKLIETFDAMSFIYQLAIREKSIRAAATRKKSSSRSKRGSSLSPSMTDGAASAGQSSSSTESGEKVSSKGKSSPAGSSAGASQQGRLQQEETAPPPEDTPLKNIRTTVGMVVLLQMDVYLRILLPLVNEARSFASMQWAYMVSFEYIRSLERYKVPVENYIYLLSFELLLRMGRPRHVQQLLQYHVPPDSLKLARLLLQASTTEPELRQSGMDMLYRLGAYSDVVRTLLEDGEVLAAMRFTRKHIKKVRPSSGELPPEIYFKKAVYLLRNTVAKANGDHDSCGVVEIMHATYAFYREWYPHLLSPLLMPSTHTRSSSRGKISPLAASVSFPDDLFLDLDVREAYREMFGFSPSHGD
eukprot:g78.t1